MIAREPVSAILGGGTAAAPEVPIDRVHGSRLLLRPDRPSTDPATTVDRRLAETDFVGNLLVARIDPPLRLSPRSRREAGDRAPAVGAMVGYGHLWALCSLAYLFSAELAADDYDRWSTAVTGIGLHRYYRWDDERAHQRDASTWARELRAAHGGLLGDLFQVLLHQDPDMLGRIAVRLGLPEPQPTASLWEIAHPKGARVRGHAPT